MDNDGLPPSKSRIGLPPQPWFYTLDQVAALLSVSEPTMRKILWYRGKTTTRKVPGQMTAVNIMPVTDTPVWRVAETELIAWCKWRGVVLHRRVF